MGASHRRTPPDWIYAHEKRQRLDQWERERILAEQHEQELRQLYEQERAAALQAYIASAEGRRKYEETYPPLLAFHQLTDPHYPHQAAHEAALARIERLDFRFPEYSVWVLSK